MGSLQDEMLKKGLASQLQLKKEPDKSCHTEMGKYNKNRKPKTAMLNDSQKYSTRQGDKYNHKLQDFHDAPTTPYNFVSLMENIISSPLNEFINSKTNNQTDIIKQYKEYILSQTKHTGYIELEIETRTPCFIGGNGVDFFAPTGKPLIPGSTLRGLTKNIFKIVTGGAMRKDEDITDRHLYFRCIMASNSNPRIKKLSNYYKARMTYKNKNGEECKKTKPGFLVRIKNDYFICPAKCKSQNFEQRQQPAKAMIEWYEDSAACFTGFNKKKTSFRIIYDGDWEHPIQIAEAVIADYRADKNRRGINLLEDFVKKNAEAYGFTKKKDISLVVPCFYVEQDGVIQHFGHGRSYRIPYERLISAHIPAKLKLDTIDFADAVFGKKEFWASRLCFEDALLVGTAKKLMTNYATPLLSPNPTSFQLYLQQQDNDLQHWDNDANLRGYKLYWHKNINENTWKIDDEKNKIERQQKITPLSKGAKFKGKIRFNDLSDVELGALLKVFCLAKDKQDICYKLGMGKSLGMGSVKVAANLYLIDETKRYNELFSEKGWQEAISKSNMQIYLDKFAAYLKNQLVKTNSQEQYEKILNELTTLLDWENTKQSKWLQKTAYMKNADPRYISRQTLPSAIDVVKQ